MTQPGGWPTSPPRPGRRAGYASGSAVVGPEHLLAGLLADQTNLAQVILNSMEIEPDAIRSALAATGVTFPTRQTPDRAGPGAGAGQGSAGQGSAGQDSGGLRFSG